MTLTASVRMLCVSCGCSCRPDPMLQQSPKAHNCGLIGRLSPWSRCQLLLANGWERPVPEEKCPTCWSVPA